MTQNRTIPGILLVTFGASGGNGERGLAAFAEKVRSAFPGYHVRWAFTAKKEQQRSTHSLLPGADGLRGMTIPEALDRFHEEKRPVVVLQPLYLTAGHEYASVRAQVLAWEEKRPSTVVTVGAPLLTDAESARALLRAMRKAAPPVPGEAIVWVAHGNSALLPEGLRHCIALGAANEPSIHVGTLAEQADAVITAIRAEGNTAVRLMPLFVLAGRHVARDLNGVQPGSWRSECEKAGLVCRADDSGMLEKDIFAAMWLERLREAVVKAGGAPVP